MAPTATTDEIRQAYRGLARRLHPDRAGPASSARMAAVNQAWFVLSDPGRRAVYDASLRSRPTPAPATAWPAQGAGDLDDAEGFVPIRHPAARFGIPLPWLAVLAALAVIFVFSAYAVRPKGGGGGGSGRPDGVVEVGSCVTVAAVGAVVETGCETPHEGRVVAIPSPGMYCPDGAEAYADGGTSRVVCVRRG